MIKRINLLQNVGVFNSDNAVHSHEFKRIVMIYAENGSGKTTLTEILRSLETGDESTILTRRRFNSVHEPQVVIEYDGEPSTLRFQNKSWNEKLSNIRVFDDVFVDKNVYSGLAVDPQHRQNLHDFVLGEQGVTLSHQKQKMVQLIADNNQKQKKIRDSISEERLYGVPIDEFCNLPSMPDIEAKINAARKELDAAQHNDVICNTPLFENITLPSFDVDAICKILSQGLTSLGRDAETKVINHIESLKSGGESWISEGMRYMSGDVKESCPFCGQKTIDVSLIKHYSTYFSDEYTRLKRNISGVLRDIHSIHSDATQGDFTRIVEANQGLEPTWKKFGDVSLPKIDTKTIGGDWISARDVVIRLLEAKQVAPLEIMCLNSSMLKPYERHMTHITDANNELTICNNTIQEIKKQTSAGNIDKIKHDLNVLLATEARHSKDIDPLCTAYLKAKTDKEKVEKKRNDITQKLNEYRDKVFPGIQDEINKYLLRFNARFSIGAFRPKNIGAGSSCEYDVCINNTLVPVNSDKRSSNAYHIGNTLSTGDRDTLALALFFSSLVNNENLQNAIVVVDDPVSSFDEFRSLATVHELRNLSKTVKQIIILSHNKQFLSQVWKIMDSKECMSLKISHHDTGSVIDKWDINLESNAEQTGRHELLKNYAKDKIGDPQKVAESTRLYLEASLEITCSGYYRAGRPFMEFINICKNYLNTLDEVLDDATITEIQNIHDYTKQFHHGSHQTWENDGVNSEELRGYVRRALSITKPSAAIPRPKIS